MVYVIIEKWYNDDSNIILTKSYYIHIDNYTQKQKKIKFISL